MSTLLRAIDGGTQRGMTFNKTVVTEYQYRLSCFNILLFKKDAISETACPKRAKEDCLLADRGYSRRIDWKTG